MPPLVPRSESHDGIMPLLLLLRSALVLRLWLLGGLAGFLLPAFLHGLSALPVAPGLPATPR